ncbi:hypothetical protein ACWNYI_00820 [Candidatus Vidania fulgoroideorum]
MRHRIKRYKLNNKLKNKIYSFLINKKIVANKKDSYNIIHYFYKIKRSINKINKYKNIFIDFIKKNNLLSFIKKDIYVKNKYIGIKKGDYSKIYLLEILFAK